MPLTDFGDYRDARGRTPVDPSIFQQPRSAIIATSGQSMLGNFAQLTQYNPTSGGVYELDIWTGNIYQVTDGSFQTMGMNGWAGRTSVLPYWADNLVHRGQAARVLLAGHNVGGTTAQDWCPIGQCYHRSTHVLSMLSGLGIPPNLWIEMLGQADVDPNHPTACVSAQNWADLMRWKWAALRNAGMTCQIILGRGAHWTNFSDVHTARYDMVKQGQVLAAAGLAYVTLGPDDDEWTDADRVDGVHPANGMRTKQWGRWNPPTLFPIFT